MKISERSSISLPKKGIYTAEADRLPIGRQVNVPSKLNNENRFAILDCSFAAIRDRSASTNVSVPWLTLGIYDCLFELCSVACAPSRNSSRGLLRKEVIQPHLPIRLPCYDFTPIIRPTFGRAPLAVRLRTSGVPDSHGVTGGVYKARERIHRGMLIRDY